MKLRCCYSLLLFVSLSLFVSAPSPAAPVRNFPMTLRQPDGSTLHCFASGDEFYNWLHDKDGYTIIRDRKGWYTYAVEDGNTLVASAFIPGRADPKALGIAPWLRMHDQVAIARQFRADGLHKGGASEILTPTKGVLNNIVIFIRFSDDDEYTTPIATYEDMFNSGVYSMYNYMQDVSHQTLTVSSTFYPKATGTAVLSYKDTHPRQYFMPQTEAEPLGYTTDQAAREHTLLRDAVDMVSSQIPSDLVVDADGDGNVDNVCFIVAGSPTAWSTLLWPHMWTLSTYDVRINKARIRSYNFQINSQLLQDRSSVLCHEMLHSLGYPDLYHYSYDGLSPAGAFDIMEENRYPPQHPNSYCKWRYGHWLDSIPEITVSGDYFLLPSSSTTYNCYKIRSPYAPKEYFVLEYRKRTGNFERSVPNEGLLFWRVNSSFDGRGNSNGPPDEVYVYRQGGTVTENGIITRAAFSRNNQRTAINDKTDPSSFLSMGGRGGLDVSNVGLAGDSIVFTVNIIVPKPPIMPTGLNLVASSYNTVLVRWTDASDDESGFEIQCRRDGDSWNTILTTPPDIQSVPIPGLFPETRYWFRVRAFNGPFLSAWTDSATVTMPAAPAPHDLTALPLDERMVRLAWVNPTTEDRPVAIERQDASGLWNAIDTVTGLDSYFDRTGLTAGQNYCYRIRALYGAAVSPYSDTACARPGILVLRAPSNLRTGMVDPGKVQLFWNFESFGESGFEVERSESGGATSWSALPSVGPGFDVYIDRDVLPGETWFYRVRTTKSSQRSAYSGVVRVDVPAAPQDRWVRTSGPESGSVQDIAVRGSEIFAATDGAGVLRSTDNGATWFEANGESAGGASGALPDRFVTAIGAGDKAIFAASYPSGLYRSDNRGETWVRAGAGLPDAPVWTIVFVGPTIFVGLDAGGMFRSTDDGATWTHIDAIPEQYVQACAVSGSMMFVGTLTSGVYRSIDAGATWEKSSTGIVHPNIRSFAFAGGAVFAGTAGGGVYRSTDNGSSWVRRPKGMPDQSVWALAAAGTRLYAGTSMSGMFRSLDGGDSWEQWNPGFTDSTVTALAVRDTTVFAGTPGGGFFRSTLKGASWSTSNAGFVGGQARSFVTAGNDLLAATWGAGIMRMKNAAPAWTPSSYGVPAANIAALAAANAMLYAATEWNGVYRSTNNGSTWKRASAGLADTMMTAIATTNAAVIAGTRRGGLFRSLDGGATWNPAMAGVADSGITTLMTAGSTVYAGTLSAGLFGSTDDGASWRHVDGLPENYIEAIGSHAGVLYAGSESSLMRSTDNGATWQSAKAGLPPVAHVRCFAGHQNAMFAGLSEGGVYITKTNGAWWREVNAGLVNLNVHSLAVWGDYLYAGTEGGVWRLYLPYIMADVDAPAAYVTPADFVLSQNYPNPFNPSTQIRCAVPSASHVRLVVTDMRGTEVAVLHDGVLAAGTHRFNFNAGALPAGMYVCTIYAGGMQRSVLMTRMR